MEDLESAEEQKQKKIPFSILGEPVIKTYCQRNALMSAISGGIICGLVTFLFTSNPSRSTRIGMYSYLGIGCTYAGFCAYEEYTLGKQTRELKKLLYRRSRLVNNEDTG
ncbi:hypothetical protein WN48_09636 [Eufriesea mexicana]|uniref:Cytochrome c oxidase assembly protein COX20, mitochondrial n=1 Tax=Eufriesea mexicana TaxID=516756 RepID=A0A310SHK3_9HYME|nr:PREDICTED: uncharacterized protein LOC108552440 [Eufriesea mexicana]OAD53669.1 hypothetical protein WN48_09636 [Eufriesea mexicana]